MPINNMNLSIYNKSLNLDITNSYCNITKNIEKLGIIVDIRLLHIYKAKQIKEKGMD